MKKPTLLGMIWRPLVELDRIRVQPQIWLPLVIIYGIYTIALLLSTRIKTTEWSPEQKTPISVSYTYLDLGTLVGTILSLFITVLIVTGILYGITKLKKKPVTFAQLLSLNIYLQVIPILAISLKALAHVSEWGEKTVSYNLQDLFVLQLSPTHLSFVLSYITIFAIWNWVLTSIGYHKVIGFSKPVSWVLTLLLWYLPLLIVGIA